MDYCRACGAEVKDGVQRCPQCGSPIDSFGDPDSPASDDVLLHEIWDLAKSGEVIDAIKRYREATGSDLRTAKDAVDRMLASGGVSGHALPQRPPVEHLEAEILDIAESGKDRSDQTIPRSSTLRFEGCQGGGRGAPR
ncbi:MAG: zinc ribbon domain-containing protein [Planctomycetaceae bacterium]